MATLNGYRLRLGNRCLRAGNGSGRGRHGLRVIIARDAIDPEIRQRLGVHSHSAAQPFKCDMLITQPRNLAGAANPLHGGIQPKRQ